MAASPKGATLVLINKDGRAKNLDAYLSDVAAAFVRFDSTGSGSSSTSPDYWRAPMSCVLTDISISAAPTDTARLQMVVNGANAGSVLLDANYVASVQQRPPVRLSLNAGDELRVVQLAAAA